MKKFALYFILTGFLFSCNVPKNDSEENISINKLEILTSLGEEDTVKIIEENKVEALDNNRLSKNQKPLVIARGSEPGWYAEFFADHLRLLVDYGKDSLILENDFSAINTNKSFNTVIENKLNISISNTPCTEEASGEKREKSISIKYNGKTYKGCAYSF